MMETLWHERHLTREKLIIRVEMMLGRGCFGAHPEATFRSDFEVVRQAFKEQGLLLGYSRKRACPGYYVVGQGRVSEELSRTIQAAIAELDDKQIENIKKLSPVEKTRLGISITDAAIANARFVMNKRFPELSNQEINQLIFE